jgi:hypothetical protein
MHEALEPTEDPAWVRSRFVRTPAALAAEPACLKLALLLSVRYADCLWTDCSAHLAAQEWSAKDIGFVLSIDGIASLVGQVPGGELIDAVRAKRLLVATGVVTVALCTLIFRLWPGVHQLPCAAMQQILRDKIYLEVIDQNQCGSREILENGVGP